MLRLFFFITSMLFSELWAQNSACTPLVTITAGENPVCAGTTVSLHATVANEGTGGVYKWKINGSNAGGNHNRVFTSSTFRDGDLVVCEFSSRTVCGFDTIVVSNVIKIGVLSDITPVVTIANSDSLICEGEVTLFTATAHYGDARPLYQWFVNGQQVGTNSPTFLTSAITNGAKIECVLSISTPACPNLQRSARSQITTYVYPMIHPRIVIAANRTSICRGETVTFKATANGGGHPSFEWMVNGQSVGEPTASLVTSTLRDGDTVSCTVTIDPESRCHSSTNAPSNKIIMRVKDYIDPTIRISSTELDVCKGTRVSFTVIDENAGDLKSYQWQINSQAAGSGSAVFVKNNLANGDKISCNLLTNIPGCSIMTTVSSNVQVVKVRDTPVITLSPTLIEVMRGEPAHLHATITGSVNSSHWHPEGFIVSPRSLNTMTVPLIQDNIFKLDVIGSNACTATNSIKVNVLRPLLMPTVFTPNDDGKNDLFRIPPQASLQLQIFSISDRWGNVVFSTTDAAKGWNGKYRGNSLSTGSFVYFIKGVLQGKELVIKGHVLLMR